MNTERPENDDTDAGASGGGGGSAAEALGAEEASGAEETRDSGVSGDEKSGRAGTPPAGETDGTEESRIGEETVEAEAAAGPEERATDADLDSSAPDGDADTGASPASGATAQQDEPAAADTVASPTGAERDESAGSDTVAGHDASLASATAEPDEPAPSHAAAESAAPEVPRDEEADGHRPSRRRSPVAVAAVAAAVLLVGGGGAYLATSASGGAGEDTTSGASGDDTPPLLALDGYSQAGGTGNGIAPGEPNPYGATYRVDGSLPAGPGSASVYQAGGQVTAADVTRLAEALGVGGKPVVQGQVWRIGVKDGSGPALTVNREAPGAWTFQRYAPAIDHCDTATVCGASTDAPVSAAVAEKAAAPVLKAVGQDTAKLDASQVMGSQRSVNADPLVGGLPSYGWSTGVIVNAQGEVVGGTGQLKAPVKSDTYPVLSAEKTLALLNKVPATDHRMGIGGCASPVPLKDRLEAPCGESTASPAGSALTVEKAVFGLASHYVAGRQALVPSWLFEVRAAGAKDAFTVTYPAVDPKYIASPATATPSTPASPTAPSEEPTSAPKTRDVKVDGYSADGDQLTVSFTGGVCGDYAASASESSGEVAVTVTYTPWPDKVCIMIAKEIQKTVPLDEPLGDREVVGSDGKEIPKQAGAARLPETSGAQ